MRTSKVIQMCLQQLRQCVAIHDPGSDTTCGKVAGKGNRGSGDAVQKGQADNGIPVKESSLFLFVFRPGDRNINKSPAIHNNV
ncbi:UNVERIFIED_CONTAM: hypothetical protein FKN15_056481 [Acipenser sinensis]